MADFDWYGTCAAIHATGAIDSVIAGDTSGQCFSSYPLAEDGNYKFWVFADAYKATVTKEDGSEVEEDVYEQYNLGLLLSGKKDEIPAGQGIRINGEKYMFVRTLTEQKYLAKIADAEGNEASHPVTIDEVHVLKKGQYGLMLGVKGGYFFACRHDSKDPKQQSPAASDAMSIGFYWAVGPDA